MSDNRYIDQLEKRLKARNKELTQERERRESAEKALRKIKDNEPHILDARETAREHFKQYGVENE